MLVNQQWLTGLHYHHRLFVHKKMIRTGYVFEKGRYTSNISKLKQSVADFTQWLAFYESHNAQAFLFSYKKHEKCLQEISKSISMKYVPGWRKWEWRVKRSAKINVGQKVI